MVANHGSSLSKLVAAIIVAAGRAASLALFSRRATPARGTSALRGERISATKLGDVQRPARLHWQVKSRAHCGPVNERPPGRLLASKHSPIRAVCKSSFRWWTDIVLRITGSFASFFSQMIYWRK